MRLYVIDISSPFCSGIMTVEDISYLIASYIVISDGEISNIELDYLARNFSPSEVGKVEQKKIFSDANDKIPLESLLSDFMAGKGNPENLLSKLLSLSYADNYYDDREKIKIKEIAEFLSFTDIDKIESEVQQKPVLQECNSSDYKWYDYLKSAFDALIYELSENVTDGQETELLSGVKFSQKIASLSRQATEDLSYAQEWMSTFNKELQDNFNEISEYIKTIQGQKEIPDDNVTALKEMLTALNGDVRDKLGKILTDNMSVLNKKQRTVNYFTIAFMGRTKAGKSTLHKVVTHQDADDIGIGQLRTTRFNRCWIWDCIRIIDTPGIGAPGGKTDTETAKSIIDEADIICYVVTNDSIQETEFDFLEGLKERNKPLFIILNVKENIIDPRRYGLFLKNPLKWRTSVSGGVDGHIARIRETIGDKYDFDAIKIIPVQLLAAKLYYDAENKSQEERDKLLSGSNIKEYIRQIKESVYSTGGLRKSQNILDGCSYQIYSVRKNLADNAVMFEEQLRKLGKTRNDILQYIKSQTEWVSKELNNQIEESFSKLKNNAKDFAYSHYDDSNACKHWSDDETNARIMETLNSSIKRAVNEFVQRIQTKCHETFANIEFNLKLNKTEVSGSKVFDTKLGFNIFSSLIYSLAIINMANPVGWVLYGIVGVSRLIGSLFTSKEKKIEKKRKKMEESLIESVVKSENECKDSVMKNFNHASDSLYDSIDGRLKTIINATQSIVNTLNRIIQQADRTNTALDVSLAYRALRHIGCCQGNEIRPLSADKLKNILSANRDWTKSSMSINGNEKYDAEDEKYLSNILQMNIILNN